MAILSFQLTEPLLKAMLEQIECCKEEQPGTEFMLQFSADIEPDGIGVEVFNLETLIVEVPKEKGEIDGNNKESAQIIGATQELHERGFGGLDL